MNFLLNFRSTYADSQEKILKKKS